MLVLKSGQVSYGRPIVFAAPRHGRHRGTLSKIQERSWLNRQKLKWLKDRIEKGQNRTLFTPEEKIRIYHHLKEAVGFEKFIHNIFVGQKRFSIEGAEILIPALNDLVERGSQSGVMEFNIGMAHRGRLNVLANVLKKPMKNVFKEFEGESYEESISLGDVKYHLGYGNMIHTSGDKTVILNIVPNPSHLESSAPIIEGVSRARIDHIYSGDFNKLVPIIIHGDAAIAKHPNPRDLYSQELIRQGIMDKKEVTIQQFLEAEWQEMDYAKKSEFDVSLPTGVPKNTLHKIAGQITTLPADLPFFKKTIKLMLSCPLILTGLCSNRSEP